LNANTRIVNYVSVAVSPNPIHDHFDVVDFVDAALGVNGRYLVTEWSLPLDGSDMTLELRGV